jgi:hypothetical protein
MATFEETRRLAFIKYLLRTGTEQAKQPEPLCNISILTFHDAVELFLQLTSEHLNVGKSGIEFMEYFDHIDKALSPRTLPLRESMRRLSQARKTLKHGGTLVSKQAIEEFAVLTNRFLEESTLLIFDVKLDSVSLVDFVDLESTRNELRKALEALEAGDIPTGLVHCAQGFDNLLDHNVGRLGFSPDAVGNLAFISGFFAVPHGNDPQAHALERFADRVSDALKSIREALWVIVIGLDYMDFLRFRSLTPIVIRHQEGSGRVHWRRKKEEYTPDDVRHCVDFVVESALRLQRLTPIRSRST